MTLFDNVDLKARLMTQPVSSVRWIKRETVHANSYNPNNVAPPELRLLKISILENGWSQPIVVTEENEVVDGYHRWLVSEDKAVAALTDGMIPVVTLTDLTPAEQRMATIRHNRARGQHHVVKMADIVSDLAAKYNLSPEEIQRRLQMDEEEVSRLMDHGDMRTRGSTDNFNQGWVPQ